jgi:hypothetical protein
LVAAPGRLALERCAIQPAARRRLLPDARICGGEVSWRSLPGIQPDDGNAGSDAPTANRI